MVVPVESASRILLRCTRLDAEVRALAGRLAAASGYPVTWVIDARSGAVDAESVIALSRAACEALKLYCPPDFAWKCGDYGYYLARRRFPRTRCFWLIESDVRLYGASAEFFGFFADQEQVDLLAPRLRRADHSWFWTQTARARNALPYRCLFPITRLSARAIDATFARRRAQSRRPQRRALWPNDEALVATTLMNDGFVCRDLNDFGRTFYDEASFFHGHPLRGEQLQIECEGAWLAHPVLFGAAYAEKVASLQRTEPRLSWLQRRGRWAAVKLNAISSW